MAEPKRPPFTPEQIEWLCNRLDEFDASDGYHECDMSEPGYYTSLDRAKRLIRGEIENWRDSGEKGS